MHMATIQKAFKFRIYPNEAQKVFLSNQFGAARFAYNYFLNKRKEEYLKNKKSTNYYDDAKALTELKTKTEYSWLYDINSQTLQASLRNLEASYLNFFRGQTKFPRFHAKKNKQSIKIPQHFLIENNLLYIPKLKTGIEIVLHRYLPGKQIYCIISKSPADTYHVSILCEVEQIELSKIERSVGIDLGLKSLLVESNGNVVENPRFSKNHEKKRIFVQRQLSKKAKGSNNRNKQRRVLAKVFEKEANQRKDYLHKVSNRLVNENQVIVAESLAVKKMMSNHNLAKSIGDVAWGELLRQLEYKAAWRGRTFHKIDRFFPSSKTCNHCKFVINELPLNLRTWVCPSCSSALDRDLNAAQNILEKGLCDLNFDSLSHAGLRNEVLSQKLVEALPLGESMKQEILAEKQE